MNVNLWDVTADIQNLIRSKEPVDLSRLADPGVALDDLTTAGARHAARP
jgi:3-phenylpropionate/trans-cinnamate dioxygenase ferredoxin reductase subunit